jgi:acyl-CoA thioesterase II
MKFTTDALVESLALEQVGEGTYRAPNVDSGNPVVFGGQLLAQSIVAAALGQDGKTVKTIHTVFSRAARPELDLQISVDRMHTGRSLSSSTVTISQDGRVCVRSQVTLCADEPDLIRHADGPSVQRVPPTQEPTPDNDWQIHILDDVDVMDADAVGPADLDAWNRLPGAPKDPIVNQALLAFTTDGYLIGAAMRPHKGVGQSQAHVTLSTGVLTHTLTFHEPVSAGEWFLLTSHSNYAGRGKSYGHGDAFDVDGQLVASYVQDGMIRPMPAGRSHGL